MTEPTQRLLNQSAKKLALLGERMRATPYQCLMCEPIAVIGIGCRFPTARGPEAFWQMLLEGRDAITEVPPDRWDVNAYYDADPQTPGKSYSRWGSFLDRVDEFDAAFFGISPREARHMDPRQRILLETAWEALLNAAQAPEQLSGSNTSVFIGHMVGDYYALETRNTAGIDSYVSTGNLDSILANRLSYVLNLQGPSLAVDTACSSSLVALYLACQSLRQDECRLALAGGINLMLTPEMHVMGAKSLLLSPEGRCKTFDRKADGFVRGEGCGLLVLKRLADALAVNDRVLAVIRGIAINQDGRTNGISAPNGLSQQRVIRRALQNALLEPSRVTFVETHGTGTVVGDIIEVEALAQVYGSPSADGPCYLGAVKTNLGHLEGAAGAAGVIKMVLCLEHGRIPPNLHFHELTPHIALESTRFRLPLEALPWSVSEGPRCGAVSSFGLGGTNAHVILEEAPQPAASVVPGDRPAHSFRRQRHWLQPREAAPSESLARLMYRLEWRPQPHPEPVPAAPAGNWLIVAHRSALSDGLAERLRAWGQQAMVADEYRPPAAGQYQGIVYLCETCAESDTPAEAEAQCVGLLHLVQALGRARASAPLWVVTQMSQAVAASEIVQPAQAPLWGLARTVRLERLEFRCTAVDLDARADNVDHLVAEMLCPGEAQVAYRNGTRYVARLVRVEDEPGPPVPMIRETGCYLITGGLGVLGIQIARHLVEQGARHLVLAGRTGRAADSAVEELGAGGATVQVVQADVTRSADVAWLIAACQVKGPLRGIVHSAGVLDDGILENQTAERFARVMAPKVRGTWELHVQTQGLPLDFLVFFSSTASLLGSPGQGNYAAANAFLDALAHHRRAHGLTALSINWGPWADAGMAAKHKARFQAHGEAMLDPAVGVRLFARALAQGAAQIGVLQVDWAQYAATYPAREFLALLLDQSAASGPSAAPAAGMMQRLRAAPVERRQQLLEEFVQSQAALVLGHPAQAVPRTQGFVQLGIDSLGSLELRTRLEQALQCPLPNTIAFDYPSVEALSAYLMAEVLAIPPQETTRATNAEANGGGDLEGLSRDEIAALLADELSRLEEAKRHE
jgi:acyl transferase domain-containing protein/acyl carrier protein